MTDIFISCQSNWLQQACRPADLELAVLDLGSSILFKPDKHIVIFLLVSAKDYEFVTRDFVTNV